MDPTTELLLHNSSSFKLSEDVYRDTKKRINSLYLTRPIKPDIRPRKALLNEFPADLTLAPLPESTNDFDWVNNRRNFAQDQENASPVDGLSVIVPTFNRSRILGVTLAGLAGQKSPVPMEVLVVDDGSVEPIKDVVEKFSLFLNIRYLFQEDQGYRLCAARNLGIQNAHYEYIAILDCDMVPDPGWSAAFIRELKRNNTIALIGPRDYVNTEHLSPDEVMKEPMLLRGLPKGTGGSSPGGEDFEISMDWRKETFRKTESLRLSNEPFRFFSAGNVCFAKNWWYCVGGFDESFKNWGGEDNEFGYRLFRSGCFFKAVDDALAYHQEPPGKENETDRVAGKRETFPLLEDKVPVRYRRSVNLYKSVIRSVPLVSIYVPAFNAEPSIARAVYSALNQTVVDLEVCICDDGSKDRTYNVLTECFSGNPRVRFVSQKNRGIGAASNTAVRLCRGHYIGQLDSDDYLEPNAVEVCLAEFSKDPQLVCVYTAYRNILQNGGIRNGWNWPVFSREKAATSMIFHPFRMFTMRAFNLTEGFDESILNAVDYDIFLKLSEVGKFKHVNTICYNRQLGGNNTSLRNVRSQKTNHFIVANRSLRRQGVGSWRLVPKNQLDPDDRRCRWVKLVE